MAEINALVIAEHDNAGVRPATLNTVTAAKQLGGEVTRPDRRLGLGGRRRARRRRSPASPRCCTPTPTSSPTAWPRTSPRRCSRWRAATATSCSPATASGKNISPRVAAKLDVGQISDITKVDLARHLRAADLRRQRDRDGAEPRRGQGHHRAHDRLRSGAGDRRLGGGRDGAAGRRFRQGVVRRRRDRQERSPGADRRPRSSSRAAARSARATSSTRC